MKLKEHTLIILLVFLMLFVCIGSVNALENQTNDNSENEVIGVSESPDGGTFNDLQIKIDAASEGTVNLANNYTYDESFSKNGINITKAITINGNGFTINGLDKARIFNINASENIVLNNITFINGKSDLGGAIIFNNDISSSVIDNCKFINNSATTNGGAIYAKSTFINSTIKNTAFISNTATKNGGAVYINESASESTFENLTFSYNQGKNADGGAINFHDPLSETTFKNITFFKNCAGNSGGAINTDKNVNDNNSYINVKFINNTASNGGAINGYGASNNNSFEGCIFANNTATSSGGAIYYKGTFNYNSFEYCSFINNTAKNNGGVIYHYRASNFNKFNEISFINNKATNNGGVIYYRASSSSDIYNNTEFINNTALSVDGGCISVYSNLVNITFDNSTFINNKAKGNGGAINVDNAARTNNFINTKFINNTASKNGGAISLVDATDNIWNNTIFTQNNANISGGAIHAFKKMEAYNIINSSFIANNAKTNGGAINIPYNSTRSNIADSSFINNTAGIGGAIYYVYSSNDIFFNVNFTNNKATSLNNSHGGGAIYVNDSAINDKFDSLIFNNNTARYGGALYIGQLLRNRFVNIEFINNTAGFNGGAVYIEKAFKHNKFNNIAFKNNKALRNGGAIYTVPSSLVNTFENSTFENNNASEFDGGAINLYTDLLETVFNNVKFINNTAGFNGGAINIDHGSKDNLFNNTSFIDNTATRNGGAIYTRYNSIRNTYKNTLFKNNTAINIDGGAINSYGSLLNNTFDNSTFINNTGKNGGAINVDTNAKYNVFINTEFKENTAKSNGGAFCVDNTDNNIWNNTCFTGNNANNTGGAIHTNGLMKNEKIINSTFTDNFAGINGSALDIKGENINISDSKFINNSANVIVAQVSGLSILNSGFTNNKGHSIDLNNSEALIENSIFNNDAGASIRVLDDSVLYLSKNELSPQEYILDKGIILSETKIVVLNNLTINCNVGEEITLNATIYDDNGNTIIVDDLDFIIESETIDSILENTTYKSDYTPKLGRYIVSASVDSNLNKYAVDYGLIIAKYNSGVEITQLNNITYGEKLNIEFEFENSTSVLIEVTDENGNVIYNNTTSSNSIILENLSAGIYSITITTQESENYTASSTNATVTVSKRATEITLANKTIELKAFKSIGELATLNPADAGNLTYISSDEDVVLVSEDGIIFARIKGTATVTVSFAGDDNYKAAENKNITVSVTLNDASVSVENDTIDLNVDDTSIINATSNPSFLTVYYTSSNESVAIVTDYGNVKAVGEGTAVITLTVGNGETYAINSTDVTVTVSKVPTEISVLNDTFDMNVYDEIWHFANLTPAEAGALSYLSGNKSVAFVVEGSIVAAGLGETTITVLFVGNDKYAAAKNKTINVKVTLRDASVTVNNDTLELFVDDNFTIVATTLPAGLDVTFVPDDSGVYSVDENGLVIALKNGTGNILVKVGGDGVYAENSTEISVTVSKIPTEITLDSTSLNLFVGDETVIVANLTPADAGNVTFISSNDSIVDVDNRGNVVAQGKGQAVITVSFAGDNKYAACENRTITVNVSLNDASVTVDNDTLDLKVDETYAIKATKHPDTILLDITYKSGDESVATVDENGNVTARSEGTAVINVEVGDDEIYAKNSTTVTVTVSKISTAITLTNATVELKAHQSISDLAVLTPAEAGNLTYISSNEDIVWVSDDGIIYARVKGTATVTVSFAGDHKYKAAESKNITVTVTLKDASVSVENDTLDLFVDDSYIINATADPRFLAIYYASNNESVATVTEYGNVKAVGEGIAIITLTVGNGETYAINSTNVTVTVSKIPTEILIQNDTLDMEVDDVVDPVVNLMPSNAGNLSFKVSDENVILVNGSGVVTAVGEGNATVTVSFKGNNKYSPSNATITVTVSEKPIPTKENLTIEATAEPITVGENATVVVTGFVGEHGNHATGTVTVTAAGKTFNGTITTHMLGGYIAEIIVTGLNESTIANVNYLGDDNYNPASTTVNITVNPKGKENATISIDAPAEATEGDNVTVSVTLPSDATGTVTIGNEIIPVVNGTASAVLTSIPAGNTTIPITYSGDDKYNPIETDVSINVKEDKSIIVEAPDVTKYYHGPERFVVNVTDSKGTPLANKSVSIVINNVTYNTTTNENGTCSLALNLPANVYNATTTVENTTINSVVTIITTVNGTDLIKVFRNATQYYATFLDTNGNYLADGSAVRFNINGVMYERKVSGGKGLAKLNINLEQGEYIITAINLNTSEMSSNNITVIPRIIENNDLTKYYRNASQYTVKIIGDDGNVVGAGVTVTFNINGVIYTRTTNASGIAKLNINLEAGNYIITAECKECRVSNNIKVLSILTAKDMVKKYGTPDEFVATLVDGQGNPYARQTVQFNINGVLYNRVTDSAGQAKLNINLMAGQYIITSSYNGCNIANKITVQS